jgi:hypothetical protein
MALLQEASNGQLHPGKEFLEAFVDVRLISLSLSVRARARAYVCVCVCMCVLGGGGGSAVRFPPFFCVCGGVKASLDFMF